MKLVSVQIITTKAKRITTAAKINLYAANQALQHFLVRLLKLPELEEVTNPQQGQK